MTQLKNPLILDGGMSRELMRLQAPFKQPEWSALALLEGPHFVRQVHDDFIAAGADVITTNSYALVPFHIGEERFWKQGEELAALAGRLAREAADQEHSRSGRKVLVAGSLPPIFGSYEPDKFDGGRVQEYLAVLVRGLEPYVDVWLGETLSLIEEADAARKAIGSSSKPLWISFTPDDSPGSVPSQPRLRSGDTIEQIAEWALKSKPEALLLNCCRPEYVASALADVQTAFTKSDAKFEKLPLLGVYANSFVPRSNDYAANSGICPTDEELTPEAYASYVLQWHKAGANILGGCCGIGEDHIREFAGRLKTT